MDAVSSRATGAALRGFLGFFAVIFIPAWTLDYWQGWAFFVTLAVCTSLATIYIARTDKTLLASRLNIGPKAETTFRQKIITGMGAPLFVSAIVVMVLDHRFGWSFPVPASISILGDIFAALGILMYFLVVRENRYAAATVAVVEGQAVVSTERGGEVRTWHMDRANVKTVTTLARRNVSRDSALMTDEAGIYTALGLGVDDQYRTQIALTGIIGKRLTYRRIGGEA